MSRNKKRYNGFFKFCAYAFAVIATLGGVVCAEFAANGLAQSKKVPMIILSAICCGIVLSCIFFIIMGAGEKKKDENIHLAHADYIFTEFWLFMTFAGLAGLYSIYYYAVSALQADHKVWYYVLTYLLVGAASVLLLLCLSGVVRRLKGHVFYRNSFTCVIVKSLSKTALFRNFSATWRIVLSVIVFCAVCVGMIFAAKKSTVTAVIVMAIMSLIYIFIFGSFANELESLRSGSRKIADGNLRGQIHPKTNIVIINQIADNINRLNEGMQSALDEQIKSERMKSELITNVSHDIKTPLTSIINYVDLLKDEKLDKATMRKYIDILDKKSSRLKTLTEDLVEASKASTGNVSVELNRINSKELISQAVGEMQERFDAKKIEVITTMPKDGAVVLADGRHMYRVIENMLSNACKYSMERSRVYIDLYEKDDMAFIEVKNISGTRLNISEEELMQRFVRGDSSRNTEGSGLGLSIAKSLAQVQGGDFNISIDGDLFKAIANFPLAKENVETQQ